MTSFQSLISVLLVLHVQLASLEFAPFWPQGQGFLLDSVQDQAAVPLGELSSTDNGVSERQQACVNATWGKRAVWAKAVD